MDHAAFAKMVNDYVCGLSEEEIGEAEKVLRDMQNARYTEEIRDKRLPGVYENSYIKWPHYFEAVCPDSGKAFQLRVLGADSIKGETCESIKDIIPPAGCSFWVHYPCNSFPYKIMIGDRETINTWGDTYRRYGEYLENLKFGRTMSSDPEAIRSLQVRPVLILCDARENGLSAGSRFMIGEEEFTVLSRRLAVKTAGTGRECPYERNIQDCLRAWYVNLTKNGGK